MMRSRPRPDLVLLGATAFLLVFGLVMVYSASIIYAKDHGREADYFLERQMLRAAIGIGIMLVTYRLGLERIRRAAPAVLILGGIFLLTLLLPWFRGSSVRGTFRWVQLFGLTVQPSELVKLALLLHLCRVLARRGDEVRSKEGLFAPLVLLLGVAGLVALQPNLGTAAAIGLTGFGLLYVAGAQIRHLALVAGLGVAGVGIRLLQVPYEWKRIENYLDALFHGTVDRAASGYQLDQSLIALGSGGFFGKGIGEGMQKFRFLPDSHTDFIFSIVGEEGGFIAAVLVLGIYAVVVSRALAIASAAEDRFAALTAAGIGIMLAVHVLLNVAVVTGLMPTTGLPLPFLSYGGSSLVVNLAAVGILLRLAADRARLVPAR